MRVVRECVQIGLGRKSSCVPYESAYEAGGRRQGEGGRKREKGREKEVYAIFCLSYHPCLFPLLDGAFCFLVHCK